MSVLKVGYSSVRAGSLSQLFTIVALFIVVIALAFVCARLLSVYSGKQSSRLGNIEIIEALRISQTQVIELVRIGGRIVAIAVSKDSIERLGEWGEGELCLEKGESDPKRSFGTILTNIKRHGKDEKEEQ